MTDSFKMILSYYDMACTPASVTPVVNIGTCVGMKATVSAEIFVHFLRIDLRLLYRSRDVKSG